jgi:hypothetical protein
VRINMQRFLPVLLANALLATTFCAPLCAQSVGKPLNLKLPPSALPAASATVAAPAQPKRASSVSGSNAPGVYYGDTSGRTYADSAAEDRGDCDDSTYDKAQMHGSVGMGVAAGDHFGGSYQGGRVNLSKRFGSCDEPRGGISISVGGSTGRFHDH